MIISTYENTLIFEHNFWLQVLGDHSRFILNALSPSEKEYILKAKEFINIFDSLLERSKKKLNDKELNMLTNDAFKAANSIRGFKLYILKEELIGKIKIELPPTFINHMLNELEEYLKILTFYLNNNLQCPNSIHHHLLWLPDASGHASTITSKLDMVEKPYIKKSMKFSKSFDELHLKAIEVAGYMRTGLLDFPALDKLNLDVKLEISAFQSFLGDLLILVEKKELLGTIMPLALDHMNREECYYLTKLSMVSNVSKPNCNPTKPRVDR